MFRVPWRFFLAPAGTAESDAPVLAIASAAASSAAKCAEPFADS